MPQRAFRLTDAEVETLKRVADERGCSQTDVIRSCIAALDDGDASATRHQADTNAEIIAALTAQLAVKDEQIAHLHGLLDQSQKLTAIQARPTLTERVRALFAPRD